MDQILNYTFFVLNGQDVMVRDVLIFLTILLTVLWVYRYLKRRVIPRINQLAATEEGDPRTKVLVWIKYILLLVLMLFMIWTLNQDYTLWSYNNLTLKISTIIQALIIFQMARVLDWIVNKAYIEHFFASRDQISETQDFQPQVDKSNTASKTVQWIVYMIAALLILAKIGFNPALSIPKDIPDESVAWSFYLSDFISVILIMLGARLLIWFLTQILLYRYYRSKHINTGDQYAFNQLLKYIIYVIAIIISFNKLGINTNILLGGAAALLVGLGLGLQQTFNDFFSGILLLSERRIEIGDYIQVQKMMGQVIKIGLRTTLVQSMDELVVIVPNSKLVNEQVINYSQEENRARFELKLSVAYGTDLELVKKLLLEACSAEDLVYKHPAPKVILGDFEDSGLGISLYFFVQDFKQLLFIRSRLRFRINELFSEHGVIIPYPQRDLNIVSSPSPRD